MAQMKQVTTISVEEEEVPEFPNSRGEDLMRTKTIETHVLAFLRLSNENKKTWLLSLAAFIVVPSVVCCAGASSSNDV